MQIRIPGGTQSLQVEVGRTGQKKNLRRSSSSIRSLSLNRSKEQSGHTYDQALQMFMRVCKSSSQNKVSEFSRLLLL
ncbi:uncharacterized protein RBU33_004103 isoform 2-T2 [Hipposideros larvatus]